MDDIVPPTPQQPTPQGPTGAFPPNAQPAMPSVAPQPNAMPSATPPAAQNPNQMQSPTVFDTNQYHLPIEKQKKHNAGKQMLIFGAIFIIVLVVGGLLAIDAGLVDLGFELPFDLIK